MNLSVSADDYIEFLETIIANHKTNPSLPKLSIIATGGGIAVSELLKLPGASAVVQGINLPYAVEETACFIAMHSDESAAEEFRKKSVDSLSAMNLAAALRSVGKKNYLSNTTYLSITAALTTDRFRRGENRAHIALYRKVSGSTVVDVAAYSLKLSKLTEQEYACGPALRNLIRQTRENEDRFVAWVALLLAEDPENLKLKQLIADGILEK